jgi:hypothetical protein
MSLSLAQRAEAFATAYSKWPASHLRLVTEQRRDVLYGVWVIGNDYRNRAGLYGSYPPGYLERVNALFADTWRALRRVGCAAATTSARVPIPEGPRAGEQGAAASWLVAGRMHGDAVQEGRAPGRRVRLYKPIGTERISKDGYLERKVNDDLPLQRRWRAVHLMVWEAAHGPVPKGHAIVFINGDKADIRLDNLQLHHAPRADGAEHRAQPAEAARQTVQLLGALNRQIRRRTSNAEQQDR